MNQGTVAMRRNQNITRKKLEFYSGPFVVGFMLLALIIVLSLLYLNQLTKTSLFNYKISNLQATQTNLQTQKQKLQIEASRAQSLAATKANAQAQGLIKTENVSFARAE